MYAFIAELVEGEQVPPKKRRAELPWNLQQFGVNRNITDAHTVADRAAAGVFEYKRLVAPPGGDVRYRDVVIQGGRPVEVGTILTAAELAQEQAQAEAEADATFNASAVGISHANKLAFAHSKGIPVGASQAGIHAIVSKWIDRPGTTGLKDALTLIQLELVERAASDAEIRVALGLHAL